MKTTIAFLLTVMCWPVTHANEWADSFDSMDPEDRASVCQSHRIFETHLVAWIDGAAQLPSIASQFVDEQRSQRHSQIQRDLTDGDGRTSLRGIWSAMREGRRDRELAEDAADAALQAKRIVALPESCWVAASASCLVQIKQRTQELEYLVSVSDPDDGWGEAVDGRCNTLVVPLAKAAQPLLVAGLAELKNRQQAFNQQYSID